MKIVDTHCHVSLRWYNPVESLLFEMDRNGVDQALLVQMQGEFDNGYQEDCVRRYPDRFASIVLVDAGREGAVVELTRLAERGAAGVRLAAGTRSPGEDPFAIWRAAERLGLVVSCPASPESLADPDFAELVAAHPDLRIMIEHLGGLRQQDDPAPPHPRARELFSLARYPNLWMKIHGLGEFAVRRLPSADFPFEEPVAPFLEMAVEAFGPERIVWGSDYPPVSTREGYGNALELARQRLAGRSEADLSAIFGGNARALFPVLRSGA